MQTFKKFLLNKKAQVAAVGAGALAVMGTASADVASEISAAVTSASSNAGLAAGGVITIAAIMLGVGVIISLLRK